MAGLQRVPVVIKDVADEDHRQQLEMALVENIQRENLNPIEEARAYQRLVDEFQLRQEDIATRVGKDRATVANVLRLLKLPEEVRGNIAAGELSMGHARALLGLDGEADQRNMAREVISRALSVRETEALVKRAATTPPKAPPAPPAKDVHTRAAEDQLRLALGTDVNIHRKRKGGTVEIAFANEEELQRIYEYLTERR
jgi:ParB family chromosome partitioning protein